jgi:hypothetical protein
MKEKSRILFFTFTFLLFTCALPCAAGDLEEAQKELLAIQARIAEEEARYQAAKAAMERSQVIAQYVFPELRIREKQLAEKIDVLMAERSKGSAKAEAK